MCHHQDNHVHYPYGKHCSPNRSLCNVRRRTYWYSLQTPLNPYIGLADCTSPFMLGGTTSVDVCQCDFIVLTLREDSQHVLLVHSRCWHASPTHKNPGLSRDQSANYHRHCATVSSAILPHREQSIIIVQLVGDLWSRKSTSQSGQCGEREHRLSSEMNHCYGLVDQCERRKRKVSVNHWTGIL